MASRLLRHMTSQKKKPFWQSNFLRLNASSPVLHPYGHGIQLQMDRQTFLRAYLAKGPLDLFLLLVLDSAERPWEATNQKTQVELGCRICCNLRRASSSTHFLSFLSLLSQLFSPTRQLRRCDDDSPIYTPSRLYISMWALTMRFLSAVQGCPLASTCLQSSV